ncbi:MAG: hypothetical protein IKH98_05165 [Candidatus Methanomethylophilaceae archaeon]|nr:hypothetical protein [Candidatus Methanomethylophilaceae archaeon]
MVTVMERLTTSSGSGSPSAWFPITIGEKMLYDLGTILPLLVFSVRWTLWPRVIPFFRIFLMSAWAGLL